MNPRLPILLVDDETDILEGYELMLNKRGFNNLESCSDSREVKSLVTNNDYSLLLVDLSMPYLSGQELIDQIREDDPDLPIIVATGNKDLESAISCMQKRIFDYMIKPVEINRLVSNIQRVLQIQGLEAEIKTLEKHLISSDLAFPEAFSSIITSSSGMKSIFRYIEAVAPSPKPLIITGESGVGKELLAKATHLASGLKGEFVAVNIAGLDDTMFTDTLFGHKKGAFTGADKDRDGLIKRAEGGTLFLDEIGDLELKSQVKLLRLLQENQYYPLGADVPMQAKVRVIVATNADLKIKQEYGDFRKDLYYRLMTHYVSVPPLKSRKEDLPLLVGHFVKQACHSLKKDMIDVPPELLLLLARYNFPGNIRELEAIIYNAVSLSASGTFDLISVENYIRKQVDSSETLANEITPCREILEIITNTGELPTFDEVEEYLLKKALERARGNQSIAAPLLNLTASTLSRKLKKYGLRDE